MATSSNDEVQKDVHSLIDSLTQAVDQLMEADVRWAALYEQIQNAGKVMSKFEIAGLTDEIYYDALHVLLQDTKEIVTRARDPKSPRKPSPQKSSNTSSLWSRLLSFISLEDDTEEEPYPTQAQLTILVDELEKSIYEACNFISRISDPSSPPSSSFSSNTTPQRQLFARKSSLSAITEDAMRGRSWSNIPPSSLEPPRVLGSFGNRFIELASHPMPFEVRIEIVNDVPIEIDVIRERSASALAASSPLKDADEEAVVADEEEKEPELSSQETLPMDPKSALPLSLRVSLRFPTEYPKDEPLQLHLFSSIDAYVYLFAVRPNGTVLLLFPSSSDEDNKVLPPAGRTLENGHALSTERGVETLLAIGYQQPIEQIFSGASIETLKESSSLSALAKLLKDSLRKRVCSACEISFGITSS